MMYSYHTGGPVRCCNILHVMTLYVGHWCSEVVEAEDQLQIVEHDAAAAADDDDDDDVDLCVSC